MLKSLNNPIIFRGKCVALALCTFSVIALNFLLSTSAIAGHVVEQAVTFTTDNAVKEFKYTWNIGAAEFRVEALKGSDSRWFVFNGRVFYVCGKMGKPELEFLKKLGAKDQAGLARFEKGICQELPADFALRFLLSPYEAIGNIDMTGGYGTNLRISSIENNLKGSVEEVAGNKCVNFARKYTLKDTTQAAYERTLVEETCNVTAIKWRTSLSRQTGMALVRSPGGQPTFQSLNSDVKTLAGLSASGSGEVKGKDGSGKPFASSYKVSTKSIASKDLAAEETGMPAGFEILDTRTMTTLSAEVPTASANADGTSGAENIVKFLILGGNPASVAAGVIRAAKENEKKK